MQILILGTGYIAQAFAREFSARHYDHWLVSRSNLEYTNFGKLFSYLEIHRRSLNLVINCAGLTGTPNVDELEGRHADTLLANVALPVMVANACASHEIPFAQIGSGCIYNGPAPDAGWRESDEPNFTFRNPPCSYYAGSKAIMEEALAGTPNLWIWRMRMPFSNEDHPKNLLTKLINYRAIYDSPANSLSHLGDCVRACVDIWEHGLAFGTYNVVNPGNVHNRQIVEMIELLLKPERKFQFFASDCEFYSEAAKTPRSNCVLSSEKRMKAGIALRPVTDALYDSLRNWKAAP